MPSNLYTADRRLYLAADGRVVEAGDPDKRTLLVAAGGTLPLERAMALGLVDAPQPIPQPVAEAQPAPGGEGTSVRRRAPQRRPRGG